MAPGTFIIFMVR